MKQSDLISLCYKWLSIAGAAAAVISLGFGFSSPLAVALILNAAGSQVLKYFEEKTPRPLLTQIEIEAQLLNIAAALKEHDAKLNGMIVKAGISAQVPIRRF